MDEEHAWVLQRPTQTIPLTQVVTVDFRERKTRNGKYGQTVLRTPTGAEVKVAEDRLTRAREHNAKIKAFFAGQGERVEVASEPASLLSIILFCLLGIFGMYQLIVGIIRWFRQESAPVHYKPKNRRISAPKPWLRTALLIGGGIIVMNAGVLIYAIKTQASLVLHCEQRCELVNGFTCLPGGTSESRTTPGVYTVRVWNPSVPEMWTDHQITLVAGETTEFYCSLTP